MTDSNLLTVDIVDNTLGLVSDADLDEIVEAAKSKNRRQIIESTAKTFKSGLTANIITESIITRLRDIVSNIKDSHSPELALYNEMIDQLRKAIIEMQGSGIPEVILETALFKFASNPNAHVIYTPIPKHEVVSETEPAPIQEFENPPQPTIKEKVVNIQDFQANDKNQHDTSDDRDYVEQVDADFTENDSEYIESLTNVDNEEEEVIEAENPNDEPEKSDDQSEDEMLKKLLEKLEQLGENEIIDCIKLAEVVKYESEVFSFKFGGNAISSMFQGYIRKLEAIAKECFGKYINFQLIEDEDLSSSSTNDIFNKISDLDREYLFSIMKLLNVGKNEVRILSSDGL